MDNYLTKTSETERPEFEIPDFIENMGPEQIHERMMASLPEDIDKMPGGFPFDYTMPTATIASELVHYHLVRGLMAAFPEYAWGDWLDLHAKQAHLSRKPANKASGSLTFTGKPGTVIPKGSMFCTAATDAGPSIDFVTEEEAVIGEEGRAAAAITAFEAGKKGNVSQGAIVLAVRPISGLTSVTNQEAVTGGAEEETDDALYSRIQMENSMQSYSYIGNDNDYIRWAKEVPGVGDCIVMPAWDGPGTVKLVLVDQNGEPANEKIIQDVYSHIVSEEDRSKRLLPTACSQLTVTAAAGLSISYICTGLIYDKDTTTLEQAAAEFEQAVQQVYSEARESGTLIYNRVRSLITDLPGIADFETFLINGEEKNIVLSKEEYPVTETVSFN